MSEERKPKEESSTAERQGPLRLLGGMIARPRPTLQYLRDSGKRTWWVPALLAIVLSILPILVSAPMRTQQAREAFIAAQEQTEEQRGGERSAEEQAQMDQAMSIAASPLITVVFPAVGGAVGLVVSWLAWAGALYLAGVALGGRSTFGQTLRMVLWTWLPYAVRGMIQTIYILISGQIIANPGLSGFVQDNHLADGASIPTPPNMGQALLAALLSRVDLFLIWNLLLLIIGVKVTAELPRRKATIATLVVWLVLTALGLVPALLGGLFAQQAGGF